MSGRLNGAWLSSAQLASLGRQRSGGTALTDSEARVFGCQHALAFHGPTCCPSQALIARALGLSREHVNRVCARLRGLGLIYWAKARRIGAKWDHNVYRLAGWVPVSRARALALLDRIRARVKGRDHTKRTAATSRATEPVQETPTAALSNVRIGSTCVERRHRLGGDCPVTRLDPVSMRAVGSWLGGAWRGTAGAAWRAATGAPKPRPAGPAPYVGTLTNAEIDADDWTRPCEAERPPATW